MKLVDILARELAEWPVKEGVYPPGQDYCAQSDECSQVFFCEPHGKIFLSRRADKTSGVRVTRAEWQAAVDALNADKCEHSYANNIGCPECGELNAPKVVEWYGDRLPPTGTVCEHFGTADHTNWIEVKVIGHGHVRFHDVAFFEYMAGTREYTVSYSTANNFRPIRTAEQVAAEEREKSAKELYMTINWDSKPGTWENLLQARRDDYRKAIDAGYRKEPKPCGS